MRTQLAVPLRRRPPSCLGRHVQPQPRQQQERWRSGMTPPVIGRWRRIPAETCTAWCPRAWPVCRQRSTRRGRATCFMDLHFRWRSGNVLYGPPLPVASTVVGWGITAVGGSSPTATFDVWVIASGSALPTISNTIAASAKPALSTGNIARGSTLTGWTTALGQYASPAVHIDSISGAPTQINLTVYCTR